MDFDPALEAQLAFQRAQAADELGSRWDEAAELETCFSSCEGPDAAAAYRSLIQLGQDHPAAEAFHEFLIYITWQQVTEQTIPAYFRQGARLADRFLAAPSARADASSLARVRALRGSFYEGLGETEQHELDEEFRRDRVKGGD